MVSDGHPPAEGTAPVLVLAVGCPEAYFLRGLDELFHGGGQYRGGDAHNLYARETGV